MARSKRLEQLDMENQKVESANPQNVSPTPIADLTQKAAEASGTGVLHWQNMGLQILPGKDLPIPPHVTSLKVYNNALTQFPDEILQLRRLESLEINANLLTSVPASITLLFALRTLHMQHNHIRDLPPEIGMLTRLTSMYVHGNRLKELPLEMSLCTQLRDLWTQDNPMRRPFVDVHEIPLPDVLRALDIMRISHRRRELEILPSTISLLRATAIEQAHRLSSVLTSLYIPHNEITALPDLMADFTCLRVMSVFQCGIKTVSPKISHMNAIVHIDMRCNNLFSLPDNISLGALKSFLLDENCFEEFPVGVLACCSLEYLSIRNNFSELMWFLVCMYVCMYVCMCACVCFLCVCVCVCACVLCGCVLYCVMVGT
jgi:Leucine-rich repeat (LRR) protein